MMRGRMPILSRPANGLPEPRLSPLGATHPYELHDHIRDMGNSRLHRAIDRRTNTEVLIKHFPSHARVIAETEAYLFQTITHPNLPHHYESYMNASEYWLVLEWLAWEPLDDFLERPGLNEDMVSKICRQLVHLISDLHERDIALGYFNAGYFVVSPQGDLKMLNLSGATSMPSEPRSRQDRTRENYSWIANMAREMFRILGTESSQQARWFILGLGNAREDRRNLPFIRRGD